MIAAAPASALPRLTDLRQGAHDSLTLVLLRWRMLRSIRQRGLVIGGLVTVCVALLAASNVGTAIRELAASRSDTAAQVYAVVAMSQLRGGHLSSIAAIALGTAVAASLISPFTGSSNVSLFPADDVAPLRPNKMHRFTDSLVTHVVSSVGFLSLFALTALASLLTADGGRMVGLLATWSMWPLLITIGTAESWLLEWGRRRLGIGFARVVPLALVGTLAVVATFYRDAATNLFGLGDIFANQIAGASLRGFSAVIVLLITVWSLTAIMLVVGAIACHQALRQSVGQRSGNGSSMTARLQLGAGGGPTLMLTKLLFAQTLRYPQIRRPLLAILVLGIPAVWFGQGSSMVGTTLVLGIPMAATIGWAVNFFGVLGSGMTWLAALPIPRRSFLVAAVAVQFTMIAVLTVLCWTPAFSAGRVSSHTLVSAGLGILVASLLCGRSAMAKAIYRPLRATLTSSNDSVVPPMRALGYTLRMTAWGGQIGVLIYAMTPRIHQLLAVLLVIIWVSIRYSILLRRLGNRAAFGQVVAMVAAC